MRRSGWGPPEKDPRKRAPRWRPTSTLWHNLAEYAEKTVTRHRGCLKDQTAGETGDQDEPGPADTPGPEQAEAAPVTQDGSLDVCGRERQMARRTRERHAEIRERLDAGQPQAAIRRATGLDRRTVQKYARAASAEELVASMSRDSKLDEFKPYICQRWNQGLTEAAQIHAELAQRGWTGSPQTVRRYVHLLRKAGPAVTPAPAVPKTREITRWLLSRPASLDDGDQARLAAVRASCPHLDSLAGHIRDFADMMTRRQGLLALEDWLTRVEADDQPDLHSLAAGIRRDQDAVTAGPALPYSSAAMEGNVNKIKMIKRQMYGRAGFALLRKRVILHPALPDHKIRGRAPPMSPPCSRIVAGNNLRGRYLARVRRVLDRRRHERGDVPQRRAATRPRLPN